MFVINPVGRDAVYRQSVNEQGWEKKEKGILDVYVASYDDL
jgi:hypothetical protein